MFTKYNSMPKYLCILEKHGKVLGYKIRYNPSFVGQFASSTSRLLPVFLHLTKRGAFEERHYAVLADYALRSVPF